MGRLVGWVWGGGGGGGFKHIRSVLDPHPFTSLTSGPPGPRGPRPIEKTEAEIQVNCRRKQGLCLFRCLVELRYGHFDKAVVFPHGHLHKWSFISMRQDIFVHRSNCSLHEMSSFQCV